MIHSLAGGDLKLNNFYDIAKVQILEGLNQGDIYWYLTIPNIEIDDIVLVPMGRNASLTRGKILRIDRNVSEQSSPIPIKRMKEIFKKIEKQI